MLVYNEEGFLHNEQASEVTQELGRLVHRLYEDLFAQGMTILEARALINHLHTGIEYPAIMAIMRDQISKEDPNE
jgi:REP element-mobilizing transposase RayT